MLSFSAIDLVKEAGQKIENLSPDEVNEAIAKGNVILIDIREDNELKQAGQIAGSMHVPRGMLEFYADPSLSFYKPEFGNNKKIVLYCSTGWRSALGVAALNRMGYKNIAHLKGGIKAWVESGKPVVCEIYK